MVKKFEEFIRESLWTDIQRRSAGDTIRKEDDVNILDCEGLFNYIKSHYELEDEYGIRLGRAKDNITIRITMPKDFPSGKPVRIFINFDDVPRKDREYGHNICVTLNPKDFPVDFLKEIDDKYLIMKRSDGFHIYPKDDSEPTNTFLLEVLDFAISYAEVNGNNKLMIRKKK